MAPLSPPDPPLGDGVVTLRCLRAEDGPQLIEALRDPDIVRWTRVPDDYDEDDFREWLAVTAAMMRTGEGMSLVIVEADDDTRLLGSVGIHELDSDRPDIGYWVARWARGRGVAPRAARLLREYVRTVLGVERIDVLVHPHNERSQRAAEKAGFTRTGEYRASPREGGCTGLVVFAWPDDVAAGGGAG